jgi:hypothetical protein
VTNPKTTSALIALAEAEVGQQLTLELSDHLDLLRDVTNAAGELIETIQDAPGDPRAIHACAFLLARLVTDLQAVGQLVRLGYVAPAVSLTAGMLEMAHTSIYIGADEARAQKWFEHADTKAAAPWGIYDIIQGVAKDIGVPEDTARREWDVIYRGACMAKHGNPIAIGQVGYVESGNDRFILAGPYLSQSVRAWAHMALGYAIRYTKLAALRFIPDHVAPSEARDKMYVTWKALGDRQQAIARSDIVAFGSKEMPSDT